MAPTQRLLVLGGSGLVGSSVAKKAIARGWEVVSLSRSGTPYKTPAGHVPSWSNQVHYLATTRVALQPANRFLLLALPSQVDWRSASAFNPSSYTSLLPSCTAVVSTLGILLEGDSYKQGGQASPLGVLKGMVKGFTGDRGNPLGEKGGEEKRSYERMNRDAGELVFIVSVGLGARSSLLSALPSRMLSQSFPSQRSLSSTPSALPTPLPQPLPHPPLFTSPPKTSFARSYPRATSQPNEKQSV